MEKKIGLDSMWDDDEDIDDEDFDPDGDGEPAPLPTRLMVEQPENGHRHPEARPDRRPAKKTA